MRIRAAATAAANAAAADDAPAEGARPIRTGESAYRPSKASRTRAVHYGVTLSRDQEMAYIRADLRRLLWISGALLVGMLVLLAVLPV
jgi:hypothetical protein